MYTSESFSVCQDCELWGTVGTVVFAFMSKTNSTMVWVKMTQTHRTFLWHKWCPLLHMNNNFLWNTCAAKWMTNGCVKQKIDDIKCGDKQPFWWEWHTLLWGAKPTACLLDLSANQYDILVLRDSEYSTFRLQTPDYRQTQRQLALKPCWYDVQCHILI